MFAVVSLLVVVNNLRLFGDRFAHWGDSALQMLACLGAIGCGLVVARRVTGPARLWRLLIVAATTSWLVAQSFWWWQALVVNSRMDPLPPIAVAGYFMFPALALLALVVLARAAKREASVGRRERWTPYAVVTTVLDGLMAAASFAILVWSSGTGRAEGFALSRSGGRPVTILYPLIDLIVVVTAVLLALAYRADRRYRANYMLLAAGVIMVVSSDRLVAYLASVGVDSARMWARAGFVLGPLLIAYAVLELRRNPAEAINRSKPWTDWSQPGLPYVGAVGMAVLLGFHTLVGQHVDAVQVVLGVLVVCLMVARQLVALRENRRLIESVYAGQRRLIHQVHHDSLTALPNRLLFANRLDAALKGGEPFVLVFLDLDDFKDVNDQFGHAAGDQLLKAVGQRLRGWAREGDTVARIGGDEFAILVQDDCSPHENPPELFADRFQSALRRPFALHGSSVKVRASMGLVTPDPNEPQQTADELLRRADTSMYAGKRMGKDTAVVYAASARDPIDFPTALRRASGCAPAGFSLAYQCIVRLPDATPVAVEALARWTAPNGTQIPPQTFVSTAEAAGLGAELDALVLDMACREVMKAGLTLSVHVNVSAARLGNPGFEQTVVDTLARHGMAPSQLVVEITETVPIVDLTEGAAAIERLRAAGVRVALDDFGAGYNSLTYLHALPVDIIKLDQSMTIGIEPNHDAALYSSVMVLCDALQLEVIAEGIETVAQADTIRVAGCHLAQGYLFGRPIPIAELVAADGEFGTKDMPGGSTVHV